MPPNLRVSDSPPVVGQSVLVAGTHDGQQPKVPTTGISAMIPVLRSAAIPTQARQLGG